MAKILAHVSDKARKVIADFPVQLAAFLKLIPLNTELVATVFNGIEMPNKTKQAYTEAGKRTAWLTVNVVNGTSTTPLLLTIPATKQEVSIDKDGNTVYTAHKVASLLPAKYKLKLKLNNGTSKSYLTGTAQTAKGYTFNVRVSLNQVKLVSGYAAGTSDTDDTVNHADLI